MRRFIDWPINRKLSTIVLATSGLLILAMASAVTADKYRSFRNHLRQNMATLSEIVGANTTAALTFRDQATATELLNALQAEKSVLVACLFDADLERFAVYRSPAYSAMGGTEPPSSCPVLTIPDAQQSSVRETFETNRFSLTRPILLNERIIGYIGLLADLEPVNRQIRLFILLLVAFSLLLFTAALIVTSRLNRTLIRPITHLVRSMQRVSQEQTYAIRVTKEQEDELGILIDGFNEMLSQIEKRDFELDRHRHQLADLVDQRTEELRRSNEQLMEEIEERKAAQDQLAHAQKMEAIGTLAGGVAHDLNNILSGVVSYPDLLLANLPEDSPLYNPLRTIRTSGKKAAAIVQDLLTLARRGVKVEETVELGNLIREYLDSPENRAVLRDHPGVTLEYDPPMAEAILLGSPVHLSKMLMNLIANAAEAMPDGGSIGIACTVCTLDRQPRGFKAWRPGPYAEITIRDTGVGIPKQYLERIFEPFYSSKIMGRSGTGLGMAVVWGTVEDHRGCISVQSVEGSGTTFRILLPLSGVTGPRQEKKADMPPARGEGASILVVDDVEEQRLIAEDILEHLGYAVHTVESGEAAVAFLKKQRVDLVLLDMLMEPGIDGLETYKRILAIHPGQKAVIASGFSTSKRVREALDMGVKEYILKPYTLADIARVVHLALKGPV